jgi:hypothetical protein
MPPNARLLRPGPHPGRRCLQTAARWRVTWRCCAGCCAATAPAGCGQAREHLGGFYIIEAEDLDAALVWASKATAAVGKPIEVWPFAGAEA